ncbi:MAG: cytochrome c [Fimbriimonadaceae bacterium]
MILTAGCHTDMWVQPKYRTLQEADSTMFRNGMSARSLPVGVVARGFERPDTEYYTARDASGKLILKIPMAKVMRELKLNEPRDVLMRGQEMFEAFCSPCHGRIGDGKGMIALRGLDLKRTPASYHTKKLREMPDGHFYDVITNGFGVMYPYGPRIVPEDRWAIVSYIRALQKSQMPGGGG